MQPRMLVKKYVTRNAINVSVYAARQKAEPATRLTMTRTNVS